MRLPAVVLTRTYVRYSPIRFGKEFLWSCASPLVRDGWLDHSFVARTTFGAEFRVNTADFIDRFIYYVGVWEPNVVAFVSRRLARGDVFVDVGANIGHHTLLASSLVGDGTVVAIEASPRVFRILEANLARNNAKNVRAINVGASDKAGAIRLYQGYERNLGSTTVFPVGELECEVQALPLDEILTPEELSRARVIKIDVEGAEATVLKGMRHIIEHGRPDLEILVELDRDRLTSQQSSLDHVIAEFRSNGFFPYSLENDYDMKHNFQPRPVVRPTRFERPLTAQVDMVFSRVDANEL